MIPAGVLARWFGNAVTALTILLLALLVIVMLPLWILTLFLYLVFNKLSGEGCWYREQRQRMECDRPLLPDDAFLADVAAEPDDAIYWLAVRRAMATSIGVKAEAIAPDDSLRDLWRMQYLGPDFMTLIYRLERDLGLRIPRPATECLWKYHHKEASREFRDFASDAVRMLRELSPHRAERVGGSTR